VTWLANGLDPDHAKLIREALIASAGGEDALARDGGWQHYRWTRAGEAMLAGPAAGVEAAAEDRPAPAGVGVPEPGFAILDTPGTLDDGEALTW
jgi:hypothetical protein